MFFSDVIVAEKSIFDIVVGSRPVRGGGGGYESANTNWFESNQARLPLRLVSFD